MRKTTERVIRVKGCDQCPYVYLERPKMIDHICAHPQIGRRFGVSVFVAAGEFPKRCPLEVAK
jgi:hypothetical protein